MQDWKINETISAVGGGPVQGHAVRRRGITGQIDGDASVLGKGIEKNLISNGPSKNDYPRSSVIPDEISLVRVRSRSTDKIIVSPVDDDPRSIIGRGGQVS